MPALFGPGMVISNTNITAHSITVLHDSSFIKKSTLFWQLGPTSFPLYVHFHYLRLNKEFQNSVFSIHSLMHRLTNTDLYWTMLKEELKKTTLKKLSTTTLFAVYNSHRWCQSSVY